MSETNGVHPDWQTPGDDVPVVKGYPLLRCHVIVTVADMLRELGCQGDGREYRDRLAWGESIGGGRVDREGAVAFTLRSMWPGYPPRNDAALEAAWSGGWMPRRRGA